MKITLRQLEIFLALAETEHLGEAAARLHLSPSAASASLASLESALGAPLFDRVGRGLRLNNDGRRVREVAARTLVDAAEVEMLLETQASGRLVVGSSTTIATHLLGLSLAAFAESFPGVSIEVRVGNTEEVAICVVNRTVDVAFVEGAVVDEAVRSEPWRTDRLVLFTAPTHRLAKSGRVSREDLAETWVLREHGSGTRETFVSAIADDGARLGRVLEVGSSGAVASVVAAGCGIGCLSELVIEQDLATGRVVELTPPMEWDLTRTLWRLTTAVGETSSLGRAFIDHLAAP